MGLCYADNWLLVGICQAFDWQGVGEHSGHFKPVSRICPCGGKADMDFLCCMQRRLLAPDLAMPHLCMETRSTSSAGRMAPMTHTAGEWSCKMND